MSGPIHLTDESWLRRREESRRRGLRDKFAMAAEIGILAGGWDNNKTMDEVASLCYEQADAMLAERDKK